MRSPLPILIVCLAASIGMPALARQPSETLGTDPRPSPSAPPGAEQRAAEIEAAGKAAEAAALPGPRDVSLGDRAKLHLPPQRSWIPRAEADRLMRAWGNPSDPSRLGLIVGSSQGHEWVAVVTFANAGYVKDDEAQALDADKLLATIRENQEEGNKDRVARGFPGLVVGDWLQPPRYDAASKRLVWALPLWNTGQNPDDATINYNTRALGREGYFTLDLLTDRSHFAAEQPEAETLLAALDYVVGQRYADFNPSTDHVAEYGLAALISAVALKKLGLIALATAFVLKFAKLGLVAVIGIGAAIRRFVFARNRKPPTA